jgi:membrane fusion protein (multidrug efflux system)
MNRIRAISLLLVLLAEGCTSSKNNTVAANTSAVQTVDVVGVVSQPLNIEVKLPAELQPYEVVAIFPKVSGFVEKISVDRGSHVKSGQLMALLSAPEVVSRRAEAQSQAQAAESQLASAQAKLAADEGTYQKLKSAAQTPGVVAGNDLLLAEKTAEADQSQVKALERSAEAAKQALQAVTATEQYLRITAPFDGIVTERNVHPGALVGNSQSMPLVRVETLHRLRLVVPVPEIYIGAVPEGTKVAFTVPAYPDVTFSGTIARISHSVDVKTRTMPVELEVSNADGRLTPGTFADVRWPVRRPSPTLFVPTACVGTNLERTFVIRVRDGKTEWVDVKTGAISGKLTEVFGDLQPGDDIAARGTDELAPGTKVNPRHAQSL